MGYACKKYFPFCILSNEVMSALSAGNSELFRVGAVGVIKDLMKYPKSESYSVFSAWESISFIFGSASPITVIQEAMLAQSYILVLGKYWKVLGTLKQWQLCGLDVHEPQPCVRLASQVSGRTWTGTLSSKGVTLAHSMKEMTVTHSLLCLYLVQSQTLC